MKLSKLFLAQEEDLNVVKLLEAEKLADKTGQYDVLYKEVEKLDNATEEEEEDLETDTSDEETVEDTDTEEGGETWLEENSEGEDIPEDAETQEAIESFRSLKYVEDPSVATEDFWDSAKSVGSVIYDYASQLAKLGVHYTPIVAKAIYKGTAVVLGKTAAFIYDSTITLDRYITRHVSSFDNLKEDVKQCRKLLKNIEDQAKTVDLENTFYTKVKVINYLKMGNSLNLKDNLTVLDNFIGSVITDISHSTKKSIEGLKYLLSYSGLKKTMAPKELLNQFSDFKNTKEGTVSGYEVDNSFVSTYAYKDVLPGDVVFIARLPNDSAKSFEDIVSAYNDASLFFGVSEASFEPVEFIHYMTPAGIAEILDQIDKICDQALSHQKYFQDIQKSRNQLKYSFKLFFSKLVDSDRKVKIKDSNSEYIYLRTIFIDKVYTSGAMDVHDYLIRILVNYLSYIKSNLQKLS